MRQAELFDGTVLEFPDNTPDEVIARVAKEQTFLRQTSDMIQNPEAPEEPELTAGRVAGLGGRATVQAAPGAVAGFPALVNDAVQQAASWGYQGIDALAGLAGYEPGLAEIHMRGWGGPFGTVNKLQKKGELLADALGLPKPETDGERIAVAGGQTAVEALSGAGLAKGGARLLQEGVEHAPSLLPRVLADMGEAPVTQSVIGGLAGAGAQTAVENDVNPLIGTGVGLALGVTGASVPVMARQGGRSTTGAMDNLLLRTPEAQERAAHGRVYGAASDPRAAAREIEEGAAGELVPGSRPTTFQSTGDMGLGSLERDLQTQNPERFAARAGEQNSARLGSLRSVQGEGSPDQLVSFLGRQLDEIDAITMGFENKARTAAQDAAERFRPSDEAAGLGARLQDDMADSEKAFREQEKGLWDAIDPNRSLNVTTGGLKQGAGEIYSGLTRAAETGLSKDERSFLDLIRAYEPSTSLQELVDLRSRVLEASRKEMKLNGRTQSWARLARLNQAVRSSIERTAAEVVSANPATAGRVRAYANEWRPSTDSGTGASSVRARAVRPGGVPGMAGAPRQTEGGTGYAAGTQGREGQAGRGKPVSLSQFIARNGGLPLDPETTARDWGNVSVAGKKLAHANGRSIDGYWRNKLIEAGYLPADADGYASRDISRELYRALENEMSGRKTYSAADQMRGAGIADADGPEAELQAAARQIQEELRSVGVRPDEVSTRALNEAAESLARGDDTDAITAYERAVMGLDDEGPAVAAFPSRGSAPSNGGQTIFDTFRDDPEAGKRYRAATEATRQRVGTYNKGFAGEMLRRAEERDTFRMAPSSVTANAFKPGHTGGERIKAIVKAGGSMSDLSEIAGLSLWKNVKDGILDPKKFQAWRKSHAAALAELPQDVRAQFANASLASQALEKVTALRKQKLDAYNKSVLGKVAKVDTADLPATIGRILNGADANKQMAQLVSAANRSPEAKEGLRRAVAEFIQDRFISNKEAGASGENRIRADAFQSFIKSKKGALTLVFGQEHVLRLQAIADDIKRAERSLNAVRIPGQSNTPQDIGAALEKHAAKANGSLLTQIMMAGAGGYSLGGLKGAALGAGGAFGKGLASAIRGAGVRKVDELVLEIMLDPQKAKVALMKPPAKPDTGTEKVLAQMFEQQARRAMIAGSHSAGGSNER